MKFEEALTAMRAGAKIRHPHWESEDYLMGCLIGLPFCEDRHFSIVKMRGEYQHPDMYSHPDLIGSQGQIDRSLGVVTRLMREGKLPQPCTNPDLHTYPQLNLLHIISDDWEILK